MQIKLITFGLTGTLTDHEGRVRPDGHAVQVLGRMAATGLVADADPASAMQIQQQLGQLFAVTLSGPEAGTTPRQASFWQHLCTQVREQTGIVPAQWLHVTADRHELVPAREAGLMTCLMHHSDPENVWYGESATHGTAAALEVSSLWELVTRLEEQLPVVFQVVARCSGPEVLQRFVSWMREEHGPDLLTIAGCTSYEVTRFGTDTAVCSYVFTSAQALQDYFDNHATAMRAKGLKHFPAGSITFERSTGIRLAGGRRPLDTGCEGGFNLPESGRPAE